MARNILIGIDAGTTALKAAAFDSRTGKALGRSSQRLRVIEGRQGEREQDLNGLAAALRKSLGELRRELGRAWGEVAGIGLAAQGGSGAILHRETGAPRTPLYLWNDSRAAAESAAILARAPREFWLRLTCCETPFSGPGRLAWLKKSAPRLFHDENIYGGAGEFLYHLLTEEWRQDPGSAIQNGCYNVGGRRLDETPLALNGVPLSFVAPLRPGHEVAALSLGAAKRSGLEVGLPVAGPYMDQEAGYIATGAGRSSPLQASLGTAWVGNLVVRGNGSAASPIQIVVPSPIGSGELVIQPTLTGNTAWDWALGLLAAPDRRKAFAAANRILSRHLAPPAGLMFMPWVNMPNPFRSGAHGAGMFLGLNSGHGRDDMLRAVAAGMACEFARVFEEAKHGGVIDCLALSGGASRSRPIRMLLAALFAPLRTRHVEDPDMAGARGTLLAFSRRAAKAPMARTDLPESRTRKEILSGYRAYVAAYDRLYAPAEMGRELRITRAGGENGIV